MQSILYDSLLAQNNMNKVMNTSIGMIKSQTKENL